MDYRSHTYTHMYIGRRGQGKGRKAAAAAASAARRQQLSAETRKRKQTRGSGLAYPVVSVTFPAFFRLTASLLVHHPLLSSPRQLCPSSPSVQYVVSVSPSYLPAFFSVPILRPWGQGHRSSEENTCSRVCIWQEKEYTGSHTYT